jgi:CheY-like chemotaxis protein
MGYVDVDAPVSATAVVIETRSKRTSVSRVILADDDVDSREIMAESLRAAGYDVEEAVDGQAALAAIMREQPSLLITDCTMPNMSGRELVELLALDQQLRTIPTIVISALARPPLPANVTAFLAKPFKMVQLHAAIRACLPLEREPPKDSDA